MTAHTDLRRLAEKATPGPWCGFIDREDGKIAVMPAMRGGDIALVRFNNFNAKIAGSNAAYIAAAHPQAILSLLDEIERLRGALTEIQDGLVELNMNRYECDHVGDDFALGYQAYIEVEEATGHVASAIKTARAALRARLSAAKEADHG